MNPLRRNVHTRHERPRCIRIHSVFLSCRVVSLLPAPLSYFGHTAGGMGLFVPNCLLQDLMSQFPSVLAVSPSPSQVNGQVEGNHTALSDVGVLNQTQGRVGSGVSQGARCATKPCFEELFEQAGSSPSKTGLEVYETNTRANLADSPQPPRPSPLPTPTRSVGQRSRSVEVSPGSLEFDKFAIPVSPDSSEESSTNPFSQDWIQEQVP